VKRAQGKSKLGAINWKDRHFRLTPLELSYYVGHPGLNKKATQKGVIQLARIRKVIAISDDQFERANVFCITYENWHLYAEAASTSDAYDWVERIKKAAYAARKLNKFLAFDDPWFVGTLTDAEVKQQLESANIGDFLVRQSPRKPTDFCLHVKKSPAKTTSFPIDERDGCFQIRSNRTSNPKVKEACDIKFKTLAQMIKAFSKGGGNVKLAGAVFGMVLLKPAERDTIAPMFASKFSGGSRGASKKKPKPKKQKSKKVKKKAIIAKPADGADGADAVTFFAAEGGGSSVGSEDGSAVYGPNGGDDADADADSPPPLPGKTTNLGHAAVAPAISGDLDDLGGGGEDGLDEEESFEEQDGLDAGYIDTEVLDASEDEDDGDEAAAAEEEEEEEEEFRSPVEHAYGSAGETSDDDEEFGGFEDDDINPPPLPARIANPDSQSLGGFFDENVTDDEFEDDIYEDIDGLEDGDDDGALGDESDDDGDTPPPIPGRAGGGSWGFGEGDNDA